MPYEQQLHQQVDDKFGPPWLELAALQFGPIFDPTIKKNDPELIEYQKSIDLTAQELAEAQDAGHRVVDELLSLAQFVGAKPVQQALREEVLPRQLITQDDVTNMLNLATDYGFDLRSLG